MTHKEATRAFLKLTGAMIAAFVASIVIGEMLENFEAGAVLFFVAWCLVQMKYIGLYSRHLCSSCNRSLFSLYGLPCFFPFKKCSRCGYVNE